MNLASAFGLAKQSKDTGMSSIAWITSNTEARLEVCEVGSYPTPEGKIVALDPLAFFQTPEYIRTPSANGRLVVFHDRTEGRNSKMALIFSDAHVSGGKDVGTCAVDAGMASFFTPQTHAAQLAFANKIARDSNLYDGYFDQFDDPTGGERKIVALPDGTPVPYVHSGWGDGGYPVFTLTDTNGALCAVYVDFMGRNEEGEWLAPPGVVLT